MEGRTRGHLILLWCVVGSGCGWVEYCSVSSTLVNGQKQSGTQNCQSCYTKTVEPGTRFQTVTGSLGFGDLCLTQVETKSC